MPPSLHYDVTIVGGGPAGSSEAAVLADHGHRVLVLETEKFPRYHIGESRIPITFQPPRTHQSDPEDVCRQEWHYSW